MLSTNKKMITSTEYTCSPQIQNLTAFRIIPVQVAYYFDFNHDYFWPRRIVDDERLTCKYWSQARAFN